MVCKINREGETGYNNFGSLMIITQYRTNKDLDIYFPEYDWTFTNNRYNNFKKGNVICPYERRIYDVGYMGEGIYSIYLNGERTICYDTWHDMLRRCYIDDEKHKTYTDCYVCDEWLNFQNFAEWYYNNYYDCGEVMHLDKDILCKGNRIYSPETCVFVPVRINSLFTKRQNERGDLPIGLSYYGNKKKIRVRCQDENGDSVNIGVFDDITEAFNSYKKFKEDTIKIVADEYRHCIPENLYKAMYNYEVSIYD